jgi:hypothetical protein
MTTRQKVSTFILLFILAMQIAGLFGAFHDQISCTVSPEYFTKFKYRQFALPDEWPLRPAAALIGYLASWWMGIPIGGILATVALSAPTKALMFRETLRAYVTVVTVSLVVGLCGLLLSSLLIPGNSALFYVPEDVTNRGAFLHAGAMHDATYLGGGIGLVIAWITLVRRLRAARRISEKTR